MFQIVSEALTKSNGSAPHGALDYLPNPNASSLKRAERWLASRLDRGEKELFSETVELTPELASLLLALNTNNRHVRQSTVENYASDIVAGRWAFNGESMIVCSDRVLSDGQHRCHAVIHSGQAIATIMVFGTDPSTRTTTDGGIAKTAGDYLAIDGTVDGNNFAATASKVLMIQEFGKLQTGSEQPTKQQTLEFSRAHPEIADSIRAIGDGHAKLASKSLLAAAHYMMALRDKKAADAFMGKLVAGDGLSRTDPIYVVREKLLTKDKRLNSNEKIKAIFMGWNNWRTSRTVKTVTHSIGKGVKLPELV
jgi:hypothetical protein